MKPDDTSPGPLARYMEVLEIVAAFSGTLTLADASSLLDMPKTTAHRLLKGLVRSGLAAESEGGKIYGVGQRLTNLLHIAANEAWLATLAGPHISALTEASSETCYLARLMGLRIKVAISYSPDVRWRGYVQPGNEMPINAAATAKAIMAYQRKDIIAQAIALGLPKPTVNSRTSRKWLDSEYARVRELGYATCIGEIDEGLAAIAVPVMLPDRTVFHSVGMTGPLERIMNKQLPERLAALTKTAEKLSRALSLGAKLNARTSAQNDDA